ncbi:hypothetical protein Poli38472_011763 [Pythium oligandrum]|uniref:Protein kinase domain-containing protein n=1 Tax=Pythium oligandrum TaxID=41045 RepID=A0A8K1C8E5_PYTOL|nr:hypothetical protein Poli38472_011763 [Pythium oligandrum]|eukprot:TMW58175.1 hypothetical protein Poli38472_011763 [Pythium oligandrum]
MRSMVLPHDAPEPIATTIEPFHNSLFSSSSLMTTRTSKDRVVFGCPKTTSTDGLALARYAVTKRLRKTLYGETLLARDRSQLNEPPVVLKRISLRLLQENARGANENPLRERDVIQLILRQSHPHIVKYETRHPAMFVVDDNIYIVMEYCAQGDLYDHVEKQPHSQVPEFEALRYVHQITQGLAYLHANGIAHRDVSLENVLIHGNTVKLCDFGLSCDANTLSTDSVGKLYYMAPEVAHREPYDPKRADLWSLGILLFVLLTGSPLVSEEKVRDKTFQVVRSCGVGKVLESWHMQGICGPETLDLLEKLVQVDPVKRPTIQEVLNHPAFARF